MTTRLAPRTALDPGSHLRRELEEHEALFAAQPRMVQHFLEAQATQLAQAAIDKAPQVRLLAPGSGDRPALRRRHGSAVPVPASPANN